MLKEKNNFLQSPLFYALIITLFSLVVRLAFIALYQPNPLAGGDPKAYWTFAEGILNGEGFRSTFEPWVADRPPLYSYFLAGIFFFFGKDQQTVFIIQALLFSIAAGVFYLGATRLLDKRESILASLLFVILPSVLLFTQQILTESIYLPIWAFLIVGLIYLKTNPKNKILLFIIGMLLGLLALVRREAILPGGLMVITFLYMGEPHQWKNLISRLIVIFIAAGIIIIPWLIRNYNILGKAVMSSSGGVNFMVGNNPLANGGYTPPPADWQEQFKGLTELERDQKAWELSLEWIRMNPTEFISLLPKKFSVLWGPSHNVFIDLGDLFLLLLCIPGIVRLFQKKDHWIEVAILSLLPVLTTTLIGLVFVGGWRYRQLVYPGLILLAGYGLISLREYYSVHQKNTVDGKSTSDIKKLSAINN